MSARGGEVKTPSRLRHLPSGKRHFEGWQLGLVLVGAALVSALFAVPRPRAPDVLPAPRIDWREVEASARADAERARAVEREPLAYEVRAVGETLRSFGAASAAGQPYAIAEERDALPRLASAAREQHGDEPLLRLLATQSELFLAALERWERGEDRAEREVSELGGNFLEKAKQSGWMKQERRLVPARHERRVLFRMRWVELMGLRTTRPFAPTANEWRIYYRFLLEHPEKAAGGREVADNQLRIVESVEKYDPGYPGLFARGVLYYRLRLWSKAQAAFRGHLLRHPDGPWRLRAQNHLRAAAAHEKESAAEL